MCGGRRAQRRRQVHRGEGAVQAFVQRVEQARLWTAIPPPTAATATAAVP
jgi:hypothetical protein